MLAEKSAVIGAVKRVRIWYALIVLVMVVFLVRLFYLQVIKHDFYRKAALNSQTKEYDISAERGAIMAHDGEEVVSLVLNETRYLLFADPKFINNPKQTAEAVSGIIGGNQAEYEQKLKIQTRYVVLAKRLDKGQREKLDNLNIKGLGTREASQRTYPQGDLAAQVLGFVNNDGEGKYGIEQYMHSILKGKPGQLKAITDAQGVPLVTNKDNIIKQPESGKKVVLTIDVSMQRQLQDILKTGLDNAKSSSGSALVIETSTGAIKAMANYPTYNPADFYKIEDTNIFNNASVSAPLEVGSIMKPLTVAAALDQGVVKKDTTYYDPSFFVIDEAKVTNIEEDGGAGTRSIADILQLSLNTGAVWLLQQMGGGKVNEKARVAWHNYMTNHYHFGKPTGVEQGYESGGSIPDPKDGFGLNIQFANTAFGQGMSATPLQVGAALAGVVNGGKYYRPRLIDSVIDVDGKQQKYAPQIVGGSVVSGQVSSDIRSLMEHVVAKNYQTYSMKKPRPQYIIGGKTGTAEIPKSGGGYYDNKFNGTFMGFVGGDNAQYVVVVRVNEPGIAGYAGSKAAAPIFGALTDMLIDNFNVAPKST